MVRQNPWNLCPNFLQKAHVYPAEASSCGILGITVGLQGSNTCLQRHFLQMFSPSTYLKVLIRLSLVVCAEGKKTPSPALYRQPQLPLPRAETRKYQQFCSPPFPDCTNYLGTCDLYEAFPREPVYMAPCRDSVTDDLTGGPQKNHNISVLNFPRKTKFWG